MTRIATLSMVAISLIFGMASAPVNFRAAAKDELRVCADPNNLPFSNKSREGFENRIAELVARDLNRPLTYVFAIQRDNFVKKTLNAGLCDLVIGLPVGFDQADLTRPYYQSEYAFVYRADRKLGLHSMRLVERDVETTARFLTSILGFSAAGVEDGWHRFLLPGTRSGRIVDIRAEPSMARGKWGTGSVHHLAWRVPDDATELAVRERVEAAHRRPTPVIDRFWFKSVYFLEPGGVLFELATDGPGFAIDEPVATLGEQLVLPPWLEPRRREIEAALPPLRTSRVPAGA